MTSRPFLASGSDLIPPTHLVQALLTRDELRLKRQQVIGSAVPAAVLSVRERQQDLLVRAHSVTYSGAEPANLPDLQLTDSPLGANLPSYATEMCRLR